MLRRAFCLHLSSVVLFGRVRAAFAEDPPSIGNAQIDLREQLEKGLRARRPVEFQFIRRVIALIETGVLPRRMVDETFGWARRKPSRPFQYFEFALITRAKTIGVAIPPADTVKNDDAISVN